MPVVTANVDWATYRCSVPIGTDPIEGTPEYRLRDLIIVNHLYLTKRVVTKMLKSMPSHVERDDLESWAAIGLMQAVQRFNHTMNVPFEAYATQRMRSVIMDGIRDQDWAPRGLRRKQREITTAEDELEQNLGRSPSLDETASFLGMPKDEIAGTKYKSEIASHTYIEGSAEALNKFSDNPDEIDLASTLRKSLALQLTGMPIKQATVIALHYYGGKKLSEVSKIMGLSEVKVGILHAEGVLSLWRGLEKILSEEE